MPLKSGNDPLKNALRGSIGGTNVGRVGNGGTNVKAGEVMNGKL